jgi:hypothetical protein
MQITATALTIEAAAIIAPFGGSGGTRNPLPAFRRDLDPATIDSAVCVRLAAAATLDSFPNVKLGGVILRNDDGLQAKFAKVHVMHIRVGKIVAATGWTGNVTIAITDLFGTHSHTFTGPGEITFCLEAGFTTVGTSAIAVSYYGGSANIGVEVLLVGKET